MEVGEEERKESREEEGKGTSVYVQRESDDVQKICVEFSGVRPGMEGHW